MKYRNWKREHPTSLMHALRLCKDHAKDRRNRSVERIADLMGITPDLLYKWLGSGKMPANMIPTYEMVCGIDFVSRWLALAAGNLVIDIPTGKVGDEADIQALQETLNTAVGALIRFYAGKADVAETLGSIQSGLEGLAFHRENVKKVDCPELDMFGDDQTADLFTSS